MVETSTRKTGIYVAAGLLVVLAAGGAATLARLGAPDGLEALGQVYTTATANGFAATLREAQQSGLLPWLLVPTLGPLLIALVLLVGTRGKKRAVESTDAESAEPSEENATASGLRLLAALQEEARLVDFVREDLDGYSDAQVGAAARGIHAALRRAVDDRLTVESILEGDDGDLVEVPAGFTPGLIRVTGSPTGEPPYRGVLRHGGWRATQVRLPVATPGSDPTILAPAEVEVGTP